jgi:O-antigen/teichoic acid export membrane protein
MYTDIIVLGWFRTAPDLGFYSAAQKPIQFLGALPAILAASLLPAMSRLVSLDPKKFKSIMEQSMAVTMGLALPFAVGGLLMGNQLMILLYGPSYNQAIPVFWILVISLLGTFPSAIIQNAILADNLQRKLLPPVIFGAIANLALNLYFTPRLGALGAAISTLIAQLATQGILYYEMQIRFHFQLLFHIRKIILATVVMGLAIIGLKSLGANFWISLSTAVVVYLSLLVLTKETLFEKLKSILAEKTPEPIA